MFATKSFFSHSPIRTGVIVGITSAALFALNLTCARFAYRFDTSVHALNFTRCALLFVALLIYCIATDKKISPGCGKRVALGILGLLMTAQLYTLIGALQFAQVGLVLVVFFTYPLIVALIEHALARALPTVALLGCMAATLIGLYFVLGGRFSDVNSAMDPVGLLLALLAAVFFAALVMTSSRSMGSAHPAVVMLWMMLVTTLVTGVVALSSDVSWPAVNAGWFALGVSAVLFCFATVLFFVAIHLLGPMPAAIIDNTAPVWGMIWGTLILSEQMTPRQIAGAVFVIAAVIAAQFVYSRQRMPKPGD